MTLITVSLVICTVKNIPAANLNPAVAEGVSLCSVTQTSWLSGCKITSAAPVAIGTVYADDSDVLRWVSSKGRNCGFMVLC